MRSIFLENNLIKKIDLCEKITMEVEKTRVAHCLSLDSGLFRVPKVISFDGSLMALEYISSFEPIKKLSFKRKKIAICKAGKALSYIHNNYFLKDIYKYYLPPNVNNKVNSSYIHGDFNLINVGLDGEDNLVILDWAVSDALGGIGTYGTKYIDVFWFIRDILWDLKFVSLSNKKQHYLAEMFFNEYLGAALDGNEIHEIKDYYNLFKNALIYMIPSYGRSKRILTPLSFYYFDKIINNVK